MQSAPWSLLRRFPAIHERNSEGRIDSDQILDRFLDFIREKGLELYPAQEEAILELLSGKNLILNTPTGSGKSLVALAVHFDSWVNGRRSFYTCPIKALVNEKFFALCREFGPDQVGMVTGDATVNPSAPIICCTAEILATDALREGRNAKIHDVIMDEFHYYSDRERGVAWQIPLLSLPQTRFLLMSATLGDTLFFEKELTALNERETVVVRSDHRPVPLDFQYSELPLHETVTRLIRGDRAPIYLVSFTQRECAEQAQNFMSIDLCTRDEKQAIAEVLKGFKFTSPYGRELQRFLKHGIALHHAGLLPKYRILVEKLAQKGLLKIIFGTDTLGVGVNVPLRTVLFTQLCKFDGEKTSILSVRDFKQIAGRAGRKGFDLLGTVVAQAPEHVIENLRNEQKAAGDPKKIKKLVKKKPPERGFVPWSQETFRKLIDGQPEALQSRFKVNHAMLLHVLSRSDEDGCRAMQRLIRNCHESEGTKKKLRKTAFQLFRSLVDRKIIEFNPMRVNVDLQEDFSLNHALSLYLIDTLRVLDRQSPEYSLDVLTLAESILENPDLILKKQLDRLKAIRMQEMKMEGKDFDERIAELETLEYPKPNRDFIYDTFNQFAAAHPWIGQENIRPKSIAREIYEGFFSFGEYVREYDLERAEGLLLRYLSDVYKALVQNIPETAKNDELYEMTIYFGTMIRQIDSSLLDEWERMKNPQAVFIAPGEEGDVVATKNDITLDRRAFGVMIRNEVFRFIKAIAQKKWEAALELIEVREGVPRTAEDWDSLMKAYEESGHSRIQTDTRARAPKNTQILPSEENPQIWRIRQLLVDPDGHNDWEVSFELDVDRSREMGRPQLALTQIGSL